MSTEAMTLNTFGGLNLRDDPRDFGGAGAVSLSDVALDTPGKLRTRDGYEQFATPTTAPQNLHLYNGSSSIQHIISSSATKLEVFQQTTGSAVASGTVTPGVGPHAMTTFGAPALGTVVYATHQQDTGVLRKWSGTAWSTVSITSPGRGIAFSRASNRLVVGGAGGSSRVMFSDAGDPETFGANNFVDLTPNDGEFIQQVVAWQDLIFVFKRTKFFVFTGESIDSTGNPVFNYRAVSGVGAIQGVGAVTVAPHGVYFIGYDGLWLTTGGTPVRVDGPLEPLFGDGTLSLSFPTVTNHIEWHRGRLIAVMNSNVYVYYQVTNSWSKWSVMSGKQGGRFIGMVLSASPVPTTSLLFVNADDSAIYRMDPSLTTDAGSAISWSYQTGRYKPAGGRVAFAPYQSLIGSGTVTAAIDTDLHSTQTASATLGTAPDVAEGWPEALGWQGTWVQTTLSGTGPAAVSEVSHHISFVRDASNAR